MRCRSERNRRCSHSGEESGVWIAAVGVVEEYQTNCHMG